MAVRLSFVGFGKNKDPYPHRCGLREVDICAVRKEEEVVAVEARVFTKVGRTITT